MPARKKAAAKNSTAHLGFEAKLWLAADKLRNNMDAAEPSGARQPARQGSPKGERGSAKQYLATNVFWLPKEARWAHLQANAKLPGIGKDVEDAMVALERDWQIANAEVRMWN